MNQKEAEDDKQELETVQPECDSAEVNCTNAISPTDQNSETKKKRTRTQMVVPPRQNQQ